MTVNSNDILKRAPGRRPSSFDISDIRIRRPGKQPIKNNDLLPRKPGRPPKQKTTTATSETTTNIECDLSFRQSCKRKSERLKDKTRNVRKKKFSQQRDNHTSINHGDVTQLQSFVGISNDYIDHGDAIVECESCNALLWNQESMIGNTHSTTEKYSLCCGRGKVKLGDQVDQPPKLLMELINGEHPKSSMFIDNIRRYNSMFAFTSIGAKQDMSVTDGRGPYCYRIQGQNYHRMGTLLPENGKPPKFAQQYIYDQENEIKHRIDGVR
ncbi:hypothetical protein CTI12_AA347070 [Artemisia annua]|uniref:Helitron helicase-like domain-containing protein n=1 Tax=Artemisia annua TaxID=35608 RepID=A0A2U1MRG6_ARTAN|nr:hypothetical protein CTI12_AA347070 [Artemisia annua]